jgi:dsDNA-binding SOS-regulon protein
MFKLLFNLLLIGACAGIFFLPTYGISAKYTDIKAVKVEIEEYKKANDSAKKLAEKRDELNQKYNSFTDAQRQRLVTFLPDNIDPIRFILEMEGIGKKMGMPIRGATYSAIKNVANPEQTIATGDVKYGVYNFSFSTEGNYDSLTKMLDQFNNSLRLIDITDVSIAAGSPAGLQGGEGARPTDFYTYQVKLTTYWLK